MYAIPGTFTLGFGLPSSMSCHQRAAARSRQIGAFASPGTPTVHVKSFVPGRTIVALPFSMNWTTAAFEPIAAGAADSAVAMNFASGDALASVVRGRAFFAGARTMAGA